MQDQAGPPGRKLLSRALLAALGGGTALAGVGRLQPAGAAAAACQSALLRLSAYARQFRRCVRYRHADAGHRGVDGQMQQFGDFGVIIGQRGIVPAVGAVARQVGGADHIAHTRIAALGAVDHLGQSGGAGARRAPARFADRAR